jgi:alkylated DNA repair protein alkB homolog 8
LQFVCCTNIGLANCIDTEAVIEEVSKYSQQLVDIHLLPQKSYCFFEFSNQIEAANVVNSMNGISNLAQNGSPIFLSFCQNIPKINNQLWNSQLPDGLIIVEDIIDEDLEKKLLEELKWDDEEPSLKNRKVQHFGFEFIYGVNNVDPTKPLTNKPIPKDCEEIWKNLEKKYFKFSHFRPDQLTVNRYEPGHGIPSHCDTHSCFEDPIVSLSLGSSISMEFKQPDTGKSTNIFLPRRSLLIFSGESRFGWIHGIIPKRSDILKNSGKLLTVQKRETRTSFTFRKLKIPPNCSCNFPTLCDVEREKTKEEFQEISEEIAAKLEIENVHKVYNEIGGHFSETRHSPWPNVENFIKSLDDGAILLDVGCGNGKYLGVNESLIKFGCDRSDSLLSVCQSRNFNIFQCDCLQIPFRDESVDACISIAVIHHLATPERRVKAIKEMIRVLVDGGKALIYVWAKDQQKNNKKSSYLLQHQRKTVDKSQIETAKCKIEENEIELPVHKNRTQFNHTNVLVPWKLKDKETPEENQKVFLRYYHVFEDEELQEICGKEKNIKIVKYYYDQGNHCVILQKKLIK